jgi:hypothetical protein
MDLDNATQQRRTQPGAESLFVRLEREINDIMREACQLLMSSPSKVEHFSRLFDRTQEAGFYADKSQVRGHGEQPTWAPNPAYMNSLEEIWVGAAARLDEEGLSLETSLRDLFSSSREYHDRENDHRRVFYGQLIDHATRIPKTAFMLTVPHSHDGFRYVEAPVIRLSEELT